MALDFVLSNNSYMNTHFAIKMCLMVINIELNGH